MKEKADTEISLQGEKVWVSAAMSIVWVW
jgi:hypothetical protein